MTAQPLAPRVVEEDVLHARRRAAIREGVGERPLQTVVRRDESDSGTCVIP